ncbi:MAG: Rne/Rng family ribonuclease, partial [Pseudomonadota bacterium]
SESDDDSDGDEASDAPKPKKRARAARRSGRSQSKQASNFSRRYKIQEVIRRRQVLLVQVVKEERGNKGAALTTYLSLAGRYSVLMPNTPRGGGISRKIPNGEDRRRLKSVMDELSVPQGMGLIVRTAGAKRTKSEIRRDYDYLHNLWSKIRSKTLESVAPKLIHQEGGLVHRAMRDMFDREIDTVVVQGDDAYREAKDLAKTLMPTQAKKVKRWTAPTPLFSSEGIEEQLETIFRPTVQMKSGGYLVINQTEALVAIDVNSGKSTKERSIEKTALRTNLEAAEEACRQMRLRDLAGLVVIDFIDMEDNKNNRAVEKKMKEYLKLDRARVQNNRISQFGLMEISRQRRRAGVMQAISERCEACDGTGWRRSISSAALQVLRAIEARAAGGGLQSLTVTAPTDVALYLLNSKREAITAIEEEAGFAIAFNSSATMIPGDFEVNSDKSTSRRKRKKYDRDEYMVGDEDDHLLPNEDDESDGDDAVSADTPEDDGSDDESGGKRKRRRRGRRGGRRRRRVEGVPAPSDGGALLDGLAASVDNLLGDEPLELPDAMASGLDAPPLTAALTDVSGGSDTISDGEAKPADEERKPRRRRRRRGRGDRSQIETETKAAETADETVSADSEPVAEANPDIPASEITEDAAAPDVEPEAPIADLKPEPVPAETAEPAAETKAEPDPVETEKVPEKATVSVFDSNAPVATEPVLETEQPPKRKRRGWWSRG